MSMSGVMSRPWLVITTCCAQYSNHNDPNTNYPAKPHNDKHSLSTIHVHPFIQKAHNTTTPTSLQQHYHGNNTTTATTTPPRQQHHPGNNNTTPATTTTTTSWQQQQQHHGNNSTNRLGLVVDVVAVVGALHNGLV